MTDEKAMVSMNALNSAFKKQISKRENAPLVTDDAAASHIAAVVSAPAIKATDINSFFDAWDTYYPKIVALLGWADWVIPAPAVKVIKALLAVINNVVIPAMKEIKK